MRIFHKFAVATVMSVASLALASPAIAAVPVVLTGDTTSLTGFFGATHTSGSFTDDYTFTSPFGGLADAIVSSIGFTSASNIDFSSVSLNGHAFSITNGAIDFASLAPTMFSSGVQTLTVSGTSGANASYSGTVNLVTAVPETATWAMMIAGMGMVGGTMRLRRRKERVRVAFA